MQKKNPCHGDFYEIVRDDMLSLDLNLSEDDISKMKKQTFKAVVKVKVKAGAFKYLQTLKNNHSKMNAVKYYKPELQSYLVSPIFNHESRNLLFRLRTRTVSGIKSDFKGLYTDISCPLECGDTDNLSHFFTRAAVTSQQK